MGGDSSSDDTTASSGLSHGFVCTVCFKVFPSGQALGGHQNAHLLERSFRQATPNILGAVLNHPLSHEIDDDDDLLLIGYDTRRHPVTKMRPDLVIKEDGSKTKKGNGDHDVNKTTSKCESSYYHPYVRGDGEESRRGRLTKNLLGERRPVMNQLKEEEGLKKPFDVDLELSLKSKEYLDLELKLGF